MQLSPIALFAYNRPWHIRQAIEALQRNDLAKESKLFIFSDGPKDNSSEIEVSKVRKYLKTLCGFKQIITIERSSNLGLSQSIITGVTEIVNKFKKIIVLEDDLVVSPYFLKFMNDALLLYEGEEKVISVCGYMFPIKNRTDDGQIIFFRAPHSWGWATWKRGWDFFECDENSLLKKLKAQMLTKEFDIDGFFGYTKMLNKQAKGSIDSWAIRWYASSFLKGKLSLYPWKSLVKNIGFRNTGINCGFINLYDSDVLQESVVVKKIAINENNATLRAIKRSFILNEINILVRLFNRIIKFYSLFKRH